MKFIPTGPVRRGTLLSIYLNDHHAAVVGLIELARRCRTSNTEPPLSVDLDRLLAELGEDREALERAMQLLQVPRSGWKQSAAYLAEKAGRAKLNGQMTGYSDLSRVLELEGLCLGVAANRHVWETLEQLKSRNSRLDELDTDALRKRADRQRKVLDAHRRAAVDRAWP
jgi:hypothetical protein